MAEAIGALAILACSFFAGAAIYVTLVEHPARLSCGTEVAARQWAPSYKRATVMQVSLAIVATLAGVARWLSGGGASWLIGAVLIVSVIPFTLVAILPTNNRLLEAGRDLGSTETRQLLEAWGRLHAVRSFLSLSNDRLPVRSRRIMGRSNKELKLTKPSITELRSLPPVLGGHEERT